jgi:hypothetical protein
VLWDCPVFIGCRDFNKLRGLRSIKTQENLWWVQIMHHNFEYTFYIKKFKVSKRVIKLRKKRIKEEKIDIAV